jgi:hypothetical protein
MTGTIIEQLRKNRPEKALARGKLCFRLSNPHCLGVDLAWDELRLNGPWHSGLQAVRLLCTVDAAERPTCHGEI